MLRRSFHLSVSTLRRLPATSRETIRRRLAAAS
jgi:hypothetical protein